MYSYGGGYSYTSSYVAPKRETPEENLANYRASYPDAKDGLLDAPLAEKRANLDFQSGAAKADQREDFHISDFHAPDGKFCRDWDKVRVVCERWRLRSKRFLCVACTTPQLPATLALTPTRTRSHCSALPFSSRRSSSRCTATSSGSSRSAKRVLSTAAHPCFSARKLWPSQPTQVSVFVLFVLLYD